MTFFGRYLWFNIVKQLKLDEIVEILLKKDHERFSPYQASCNILQNFVQSFSKMLFWPTRS